MVVFGIAAFWLSAELNLFERFYDFSRAHDDWELDEIFILFIVAAVGGLVFAFRRLRELGREIGARRSAEEMANTLARHDALTGLANRRYFAEQIDELLRNADKQRSAVMMLDLDGFKGANDLHGHLAGDRVLIEVAQRLIQEVDPETKLARIGGDEFAILRPDVDSLDELTSFANRILRTMQDPFLASETPVLLSVSIGIALAPDNGTDANNLVRRADLALYRAKAGGRGTVAFFEAEMDAHVERRGRLERELSLGDRSSHMLYNRSGCLKQSLNPNFPRLRRSSTRLGATAKHDLAEGS